MQYLYTWSYHAPVSGEYNIEGNKEKNELKHIERKRMERLRRSAKNEKKRKKNAQIKSK